MKSIHIHWTRDACDLFRRTKNEEFRSQTNDIFASLLLANRMNSCARCMHAIEDWGAWRDREKDWKRKPVGTCTNLINSLARGTEKIIIFIPRFSQRDTVLLATDFWSGHSRSFLGIINIHKFNWLFKLELNHVRLLQSVVFAVRRPSQLLLIVVFALKRYNNQNVTIGLWILNCSEFLLLFFSHLGQ